MRYNFFKWVILFLFFHPNGAFSQNYYKTLNCDTSLWQHVYHKKRLLLKEQCKTVTGIVISKKKEKDGDFHIKLKLDKGQENLLNTKNLNNQDSCLVIEPICVNKVTQADALDFCEWCINHIFIPNKGQHVKVTGSYVLDSKHGWMEIHPVTEILFLKE